MIAYIHSSILLRIILDQPDQLPDWNQISSGIASCLAEVECLRTLDRLRLSGKLTLEESLLRRERTVRLLEGLALVDLTRDVLERASRPMITPLGSLDAMHLATAELWRETRNDGIRFATHDHALALSARASGFQVIGL